MIKVDVEITDCARTKEVIEGIRKMYQKTGFRVLRVKKTQARCIFYLKVKETTAVSPS